MASSLSTNPDDLLLAALETGEVNGTTGRSIVTFREGGQEEGLQMLRSAGLGFADSRDFRDQALSLQEVGDADFVNFSEINSALISGEALQSLGVRAFSAQEEGGAIATIEPEYFVFTSSSDYLRGFARAANVIAEDLAAEKGDAAEEVDAEALGVTWGLSATRVPASRFSGAGIKVAILDTGLDLGHPDFAGRAITTATFVGQPVQDLHGHGTHTAGTAAGRLAPIGNTPRYGIAHQSQIFIGKVLSNSGGGTTASVLAGINWAIANRCEVISMSLGGPAPVQAAYTNAGNIALQNGLLIIAATGNEAAPTGAPANSPSIVAVASLDQNLAPSNFSNFGKVEIAGPGRDVFASWPRPSTYRTISGTSMATPHVAGCAALWAQSNAGLRGIALRNRILAAARGLPFGANRVGRGLVQAP